MTRTLVNVPSLVVSCLPQLDPSRRLNSGRHALSSTCSMDCGMDLPTVWLIAPPHRCHMEAVVMDSCKKGRNVIVGYQRVVRTDVVTRKPVNLPSMPSVRWDNAAICPLVRWERQLSPAAMLLVTAICPSFAMGKVNFAPMTFMCRMALCAMLEWLTAMMVIVAHMMIRCVLIWHFFFNLDLFSLLQCRLLWGDSSTSRMSPRICFKLNEKGDIHGNCGRRKDDDSYVACLPGDSLCGQLQCVHQNEKTEFGDKSVVITGHVFIPVGVHDHAVCRHAIVDLGGNQRSNPGLVPNGAICGENRMCLNQKCVEAEKILLETPCPDDCSGNGICNSRGHW